MEELPGLMRGWGVRHSRCFLSLVKSTGDTETCASTVVGEEEAKPGHREAAEAAEPVPSSLLPQGGNGHTHLQSLLGRAHYLHFTERESSPHTGMGQVLGISSLARLITGSAFSLLRVRGDIQLGLETWEELKCQRSLFQGQEKPV